MNKLFSLLLFIILCVLCTNSFSAKKNCTDPSAPGCAVKKPKPSKKDKTLAFRYAEIPEVVFVEGYADTEDMGIYHLNPDNLFPPGHMPWHGPHQWKPFYTSQLSYNIGEALPPGVSYNPLTGVISYDGSTIIEEQSIDVQFTQEETSQISKIFKIKVLKADLVWDGTGPTLHESMGQTFKNTGNNVVLIKGGDYTIDQLHPSSTGYLGSLQGRENVYIIGEPGNMPRIIEARSYNNNIITWVFLGTLNSHIKNIDVGGSRFRHSALHSLILNKIKFHSNYGVDGLLANNMRKVDYSYPVVYISNFETFHFGSDYTKHAIYAHMRYEDTSNQGIGFGSIFVNNYKAYSTIGGDGIKFSGGHAFKAITKVVKMRNFWISQSEDPENPETGLNSKSNLISLHSYQKVVLFNGVLNNWISSINGGSSILGGSKYAIIFQNRGMNVLGNDDPPYFKSPNQLNAYGMWPDWEDPDTGIPAEKNPIFHGDNSQNGYHYSFTGAKGDLSPNNLNPPSPAAFWDTIGEVSDPNNDELTYHKYISHVKFNINTVNDQIYQDVAIDQRGTEPKLAYQQFKTDFDFFSVPPNWKERTHLFTVNNTFNGYQQGAKQQIYSMDFVEPSRNVYPYAPDRIIPRGHTNVGGNIIDEVGATEKLPEWFKI